MDNRNRIVGVKAQSLLLTQRDVETALGGHMTIGPGTAQQPAGSVGNLIKAAAVDSGYREWTGRAQSAADEELHAVKVGAMALVFDSVTKAEKTFRVVAEAAHLRTQMDGTDVAVETVTSPSGLVSYWGFVHRGEGIVIVTLDTLDPQGVSIADLRALVIAAARRLTDTARLA